MPYVVKGDEVTVLKALSESTNAATGEKTYDHEARTYQKGAVLADEDVSPVIVKKLKDGDERTKEMLEYVKDAEEGARVVALQNVVPVPMASATPGRVLVAESAASVPDPPGAEIDQMQYAELVDAANPGRKKVDEEAADVPEPERPLGVTMPDAIVDDRGIVATPGVQDPAPPPEPEAEEKPKDEGKSSSSKK